MLTGKAEEQFDPCLAVCSMFWPVFLSSQQLCKETKGCEIVTGPKTVPGIVCHEYCSLKNSSFCSEEIWHCATSNSQSSLF